MVSKEPLIDVVSSLYGGETTARRDLVLCEAKSYIQSGSDDVFFSIAEQVLKLAVTNLADVLIKKYASFRGLSTFDGDPLLESELFSPALNSAKAMLGVEENNHGVDLIATHRILSGKNYAPVVRKIILENIERLVALVESSGKTIEDIYIGEPSDVQTGLEYEGVVRDIFIRHGWQAEITKSSGDQGADVLARYQGVMFAVQCKFYTGDVGNKAVQEVYSAKGFYGADHALVVSSSGYTKSATELAEKLGVYLLHDDDIGKFTEYFQENK